MTGAADGRRPHAGDRLLNTEQERALEAAEIRIRGPKGVVDLSPLATSMLFDRIQSDPRLRETTRRLHLAAMEVPENERAPLCDVLRRWLAEAAPGARTSPGIAELVELTNALCG